MNRRGAFLLQTTILLQKKKVMSQEMTPFADGHGGKHQCNISDLGSAASGSLPYLSVHCTSHWVWQKETFLKLNLILYLLTSFLVLKSPLTSSNGK